MMEIEQNSYSLKDRDIEKLVNELVGKKVDERLYRLENQIKQISQSVQLLESKKVPDRVSMIVFSGDMDKLMAAFIIATGAVSMEMEVSMYFTYWGLSALRKATTYKNKAIPEKMIAAMLPTGPESVGTSKMNFLGMGPKFFKHLMKQKNVQTLPELISLAKELDVKMIACQMSMEIMGITKEELIDDLAFGGVATYVGDAANSKISLFI